MKLTYLSVIIAVILLTSAMSTAHVAAAAEPGVTIVAKEKRGLIMMLVKNDESRAIYGLKLGSLDGDITSVKSPKGWAVVARNPGSEDVTVLTGDSPIKVGKRAVFFAGTNNLNTIISWSALDSLGRTVDADNTRMVIKHVGFDLNQSPAESTPSQAAITPITVTTDRISYNTNDKMIITGTLEPQADITVTIYSPDGQKIKIRDRTDATGSFNIFHVLHNAESGTYYLKAGQAEAQAKTSFLVQ